MAPVRSAITSASLLMMSLREVVSLEAETVTNQTCNFDLEPVGPGYFWDPSCANGGLGCLADGKNHECRFCGHGVYKEIPCPYTSCSFVNEPFVPYYWDTNCTLGQLGCWADGVHAECRFCGNSPYTNVDCPNATGGQQTQNIFEADAEDEDDEDEERQSVAIVEGQCSFSNEPSVYYFWDESCKMGDLGCNADGLHIQCRFCASRPFESIACPEGVGPDNSRCDFPEGQEPTSEIFFWDATCEMGMLGCWADGVNAECRFCGGTGSYRTVSCPTTIVTGATEEEEEEEEDETSLEASKSLTESRSGHSSGGVAKDLASEEKDGDVDEVVNLSGALGMRPLVLLSAAIVVLVGC